MRELRKPYIIESGIIRCPSGGEDSYHEFRLVDAAVQYRRTTAAGEPYGEHADWRALSDARIIDQYHAGADELKRWFHEHGFPRERIDQIGEQEREREKARRREKRKRR